MPEKTADEKAAEVKLADDLGKATSSEEIRDILAQPRNEKGQFVSAQPVIVPKVEEPAKVEDEPVILKDTFLVGGKPMEFTGENEGDILRQVKAAQQAWDMAQPKPEVKKEEVKPALSKEDLAALSLRVAQGDLTALDEYNAKSGAIDRYLESKGIKVDDVRAVLETSASTKVKDEWSGAISEFLTDPTCKWPGGAQNEKLLKYKLAELKNEQGVALAHVPSKTSLDRAFAALQEEGMLFPVEQKTEEKTETKSATETTAKTEATMPTIKKPASSSTAFGTDTRRDARVQNKAADIPKITDDMSPEAIMQAFKATAQANGQSPDDILRGAYSRRTQ